MRFALTLSLVAAPLLAQALSPSHIARAHRRTSSPVGGNQLLTRAFSGYATWFYTGLGACGGWNNDGDFIVAMNSNQYSDSICGKQLWITGPQGTQYATVADECPESYENCHWGDMDMTTGLFSALFGSTDVGKGPITWDWVDSSSPGGGNSGGGGGSGGNGGGDRGGDSPAPSRNRCKHTTKL